MNSFNKYGPIIAHGLWTILTINHWYRGLETAHLVVMWTILLALSLPCLLDIIYGNNDNELFDDDFLSDSQYDPCDLLPHSEEMEEEYQPNE